MRFKNLESFFSIYLGRAIDLSKAGKKDEARDWLRFFQNSGILEIISDAESGVVGAWDRKRFEARLRELNNNCHPLDAPDFRTDIQAIRQDLFKIREFLGLACQGFPSDPAPEHFRSYARPASPSVRPELTVKER